MGKLFGIVVIVAGLWAGAEIYNEGSANAFGGALVRAGMVEPARPGKKQRMSLRVESTVGKAQADAEERRTRMLGEE